MIYKSYCAINIEYYPFDIQDCYMKFGSWTFNGEMIDLEHIKKDHSVQVNDTEIRKDGTSNKLYTVEMGIDMTDYYDSVEWDILSIPAQKNIKYYECCPEPYYDIYFNITIRRKTLFYTVNLIIPCVNISFLSVLVFYLPSDSGEKLTLGISILVALLVFYLLLIELIPPTSLVIPLLGKYLLFTLILVNLSILLTIFILNLHHRKPNTHKMPFWMKRVVIDILPKMLMIERPKVDDVVKMKNIQKAKNLTKAMEKIAKVDLRSSSPSGIKAAAAAITPQIFLASPQTYSRTVKRTGKVSFGQQNLEADSQTDEENSRPQQQQQQHNYLPLYKQQQHQQGEREELLAMDEKPMRVKSHRKYYQKTFSDALDVIKYINSQMKKDNVDSE